MPHVLRYGVFRLGDTWTLVGEDGSHLGFRARVQALAAGLTAVAAHRAFGQAADLVVQDKQGRLIDVDDLGADLDFEGVPPGPLWDPFALPSSFRHVS